MARSVGIEFCWVRSQYGHYWNEMPDKLAKQGAMKSILEKTVYKELQKRQICDTFMFKVFSESNIQVPPKFMEH